MNLVKQFLKSQITVKSNKKHFNKNLIITEEEEKQYQSSNTCQICKKLIDHDDENVRDLCNVTGKVRGAAHQICNINLRLAKKVLVIFHNLRGQDSHLIFNELSKFDVKIDVIANGLEKQMASFFKAKAQSLLTVCNLSILALINQLKTCQTMISNI